MTSIIKPYKAGYILYDVTRRKFTKLLQEECNVIEASKILERDGSKVIKIQSCKDLLFTIKQDEYIFVETRTPLKVFWDITEECNARCIHCFTNAGEKSCDELSTKQVFEAIDELVKYGIMGIAFSGGEPLIRSDFIDILQYASDKGMFVSFTTNGALFNIEKIKKIIGLQLKSVTVSLDGFSQEISSKIRKGISVEGVKENIKLLSRYADGKNIEINVRTTLNKINKAEIYDILRFCDEVGVDCLKINNTNLWGRAKENSFLRLEEKDFINTLIQVEEKSKKCNCRVELPIEKYLNMEAASFDSEICTSTVDTINIFANGDICACGFCEKALKLGNIVEDGLTKIFENSLPFDFQNDICNNCDIHRHSKKMKLTNTTSFIN